jgi:hypothetical protein
VAKQLADTALMRFGNSSQQQQQPTATHSTEINEQITVVKLQCQQRSYFTSLRFFGWLHVAKKAVLKIKSAKIKI